MQKVLQNFIQEEEIKNQNVAETSGNSGSWSDDAMCPYQMSEWISEPSTPFSSTESSSDMFPKAKRAPGKTYSIDTSEASSAKPLLDHIISTSNRKLRGSVDKVKSNIRYMFCNIDDEEIIKVLGTKGRTVNRYPGIKGLCHKDKFS